MSIPAERFQDAIKAYQSGNFEEAERVFLECLEIEPFSTETMLNLGNVYFKTHRLPQAEEQWLKAISINPLEEKAYLNLGNMFYAQQRYEKAIYYWEIFRKLDPLNSNVHINLGLAYEATADLPRAFCSYNLYLKAKPNSPDAPQLRARINEAKEIAEHNLQQAEIWMRSGHLAKARKAFECTLKLVPTNPKVYKHYAAVLYELGELPESARWYEKACRELQGDTGVLINLGVIYEKMGEPFHALWAYASALKMNPKLASTKAKQRYDAIWDQFGGPQLLKNHMDQVHHYLDAGEFELAHRTAQRLFDIAFTSTPVMLAELKPILQSLEDRKDPHKVAANVAYGLAEDFRSKGQYEKALRFYDRYLELYPDGDKAADVRDKQDQITKVIQAVVGSLLSEPETPVSAA